MSFHIDGNTDRMVQELRRDTKEWFEEIDQGWRKFCHRRVYSGIEADDILDTHIASFESIWPTYQATKKKILTDGYVLDFEDLLIIGKGTPELKSSLSECNARLRTLLD